MIRRHFFLMAALCVIALMVVVGGLKLATTNSKGAEKAGGGAGGRATTVASVTVGQQTFADSIEVLGVAKGRESVTITSNTAELVTAVRFRDGQHVAKGQVLVELKSTEEDAGVAEARSVVVKAQGDFTRWNTLAEKGIAAKATVDQYRAALDAARASLDAAQSRKLDRVIRAPFAGVVGLSDVAPGALIAPGAAIVSLDDLAVIRVDFDVPDRYLPLLREGLAIVAHPDAYPDRKFTGRIAKLDSRIDQTTRAIKARAEFPNADGALRPGMMLTVSIDQGRRTSVAVPEAAVQFEADQPHVFIIAQREGQTVAQERAITVGVKNGGMIEVLDGLKVGDRIVADGVNRVQANRPVRLVGPGGDKRGAKPGAQPAGKGGPRPAGGGAAAPGGGR